MAEPNETAAPPVAITASARRIDVKNKAHLKLIEKSPSKASDEAWQYYDLVPEVKFAGNFVGNAMSRIRMYAGIVVNDDEPPSSIEDAAKDAVTIEDAAGAAGGDVRATAPIVEGLTDAIAEATRDELSRMSNRRTGQAGLMREWGVGLTMVGDTYLIADDIPPDELDADDMLDDEAEDWNVYSASNLKRIDARGEDSGLRLILDKNDKRGRPLGPDALIYRIWKRHSRWPNAADSNMFACAEVCDELLIFSRQMRAIGKSGTANGLLLFPSETDFPDRVVESADGSTTRIDGWTQFVTDLVEGLIGPTEDDGHPQSVAPYFARIKGEFIDKIKKIELGRPIDENAIARIEHLIARLAHGLDVPVEILTGIADVNHWTAWQIEDSTYKAHIEPLAMIPAAGVTTAFLRPAIVERLGDQLPLDVLRRIVVGLDPGSLVVRPNRGQDAKDAFDKGAISWAALRKYLGFPDTDAPSAEEWTARLAFLRSIGGMALTRDLLHVVAPDADIPTAEEAAQTDAAAAAEASTEDGSSSSSAEADQPIPAADDANDEASARARLRSLAPRAAAATGNGHDPRARVAAAGTDIGARLSAIDQRLRDRILVDASHEMTETLRVAGSRLRSAANNAGHRSALEGVPAGEVGATLGVETVRSLAEVDDLLDGAFEPMQARWESWVAAAQAEAARVVASAAPSDEVASHVTATATAGDDDDRHAGWLLLFAALMALARERVTDPTFGGDDRGEIDTSITVPVQEVRRALARAGGELEPTGVPSSTGAVADLGASGGVATGPRVMRALDQAGQMVVAYEWHVGMPSRPFEPHQALAGLRFESFDDDRLLNASGWPSAGHYFPSDHKGCQCDAVPVVVPASELAGR